MKFEYCLIDSSYITSLYIQEHTEMLQESPDLFSLLSSPLRKGLAPRLRFDHARFEHHYKYVHCT